MGNYDYPVTGYQTNPYITGYDTSSSLSPYSPYNRAINTYNSNQYSTNPYGSDSAYFSYNSNNFSPGDLDELSESIDSKLNSLKASLGMTTGQTTFTNNTASGSQLTQVTNTAVVAGPTQEEIQWALQLEEKVKTGYQPTAEEITKYQTIATKVIQADQTNQTQNTTTNVSAPTQEEIQWALQLEEKVKTGYQPTAEEITKYQKLADQLKVYSQQNQNKKDWLSWAQPFGVPTVSNTTSMVPTSSSKTMVVPKTLSTPKVQTVPATLTTNQVQTNNVTQQNFITSKTSTVSSFELNWAIELQNKIQQQGYKPSQNELLMYTDIFNRYQNSQNQTVQPQVMMNNQPTVQPQNLGMVTQGEIQWALQLEEKVKTGYQPNPQEVAQYKNIADKLAAYSQNINPQQPVMNQPNQQYLIPINYPQVTNNYQPVYPQNQQGQSNQGPSFFDKLRNGWNAFKQAFSSTK